MFYAKRALVIFFLLNLSFILYSQEDETLTDDAAAGDLESGDETEDDTEKSLFYRTLGLDIESADYYELLSWCQRLEIDESGDKETLKRRIYNFYGISPSPDSQAESSGGDVIIIRSANNSEYFTIEEVDEDYLVLQGDVILEFTSNKSSEDPSGSYTTHIMEAQRIVINQTESLLTATGDIKYTLIHENSDDEPEVFYGNTFTFNIDTWNGVFIEGRGETIREVEEGEEVNFFYVGDTLTRMDNDIVLLEDGIITSCDQIDDPHWHIKASKIWVLAPGEWAITNGIMHVGRVPIMYIPFFFKSGDEVFFHPSFGYKKEEGVFIQTTTYILGQKQSDTSSFSFLRETGYDNDDYNMEIHGLFLRRGERKDEEDKEQYIFKIALDYYTRLGFFTGLAVFPKSFADEESSAPGNYFALTGGLGISRSIFPNANTFSPYYNNELKSHWHYISYFGLEIPLRCGLKTKVIFNKGFYSLNGEVEFYSDPFFSEDFYEREEEFNWDRFLNRETQEDALQEDINVWDFNPEEKNNLSWQLDNDFAFSFSNPYLKNISINDLSFYMTWKSAEDPDMTSGDINQADPTRKYFYPVNLKFPNNMNINLSGELLNLPIQRSENLNGTESEETDNDPGRGIHLPESDDYIQQDEDEREHVEINFKGIDIKDDESVESSMSRESSFTLGYSITPKLLIENQFNHEEWTSQEDVDFEMQFSNLTNSNDIKLDYNLVLWGSFIKINGVFGFNSTYKKHFNQNVSDEEWASYLESDYMSSGFYLNKDLNFYVYPLKYTETFANSNINYKLNWDYLKYQFDEMNGSEPVYEIKNFKWNDEYVNTHKVNNSFIFSKDSVNYFNYNFNLPPKLGEYDWLFNYKLDLYYWYLNTYITFGYTEIEEEEWEFDPFSVTETFNFGRWMNYVQTSVWDFNHKEWNEAKSAFSFFNFDIFGTTYFIEQELLFIPKDHELNSSVTRLNFRDLSVSFTAEMLVPIQLDINESPPWQETGEDEEFQPKLLSINYSHSGKPHYIWKNRIEFFTNIHSDWELNLYKFTDSSFTFGFDLTFNVYKFIDFYFGMDSYNNYSYRYIPSFAKEAGDSWVNPFFDILKSFNIFNKDDRYDSNFKLKQIELGIVHHLHDWDLTFSYTGVQEEVVDGTDRHWEWKPSFSIILEWNPIPEIKHEIFKEKDDDEVTYRG